jgi:hypothetical protein
LPLFLDILREFRSADFQRDYEIVLELSKATVACTAGDGDYNLYRGVGHEHRRQVRPGRLWRLARPPVSALRRRL